MSVPLLQVFRLSVRYSIQTGSFWHRSPGLVKAVEDVSFSLDRGMVLGVVGESGCGKSTLSRAIMRLVPASGGQILFEGDDLLSMGSAAFQAIRPALQMVFQDPFASLNPRMSIGAALSEPLQVHHVVPLDQIPDEVDRLLDRAGLNPHFAHRYPHEFSGGQRQRIAIARALALRPKLLVADEPVSALDVSVQAQILNLLAQLVQEESLSMILVSHDLAVVRHLADHIAVMYLGHIVEIGDTDSILNSPFHPYTRVLLSAVPDPSFSAETSRAFHSLPGDPPSPVHPPSGCPFHPRCPMADSLCAQVFPPFVQVGTHKAACLKIHL